MYSSHTARSGVGLDELFRWGDHVCHFFRSGDDLGEILVPYFKAGLERNELCVWVTGHPYGRDRAVSELRAALSNFDQRTAAGQMQIFGQDEWYAKQEMMSTAERVQSWLSRKDEAVALGYAGLRANGNTSFLEESAWNEFLIYEQAVSEAYQDERCIGLCSYWMDKCSGSGVIDVTHCHGLSLAKRHGHWDLIEVRDHSYAFLGVEALGYDPVATSEWQGEDLRRLVEDQLAVFIGSYPERIWLKGGHVPLSGPQATKLGIVLDELVANAARYGAFSSTQGKLAVQWRVVVNGSRRLHIKWSEHGMSGLVVPDAVGFGTRLIASAVENCVRIFKPTGMVCTFELSLESDCGNLR